MKFDTEQEDGKAQVTGEVLGMEAVEGDGAQTAEARLRAGRDVDWRSEVEPWEEAVDGGLLLDALAGVMRNFVVLPEWAPEALALWVLHTYAFELGDVSTYLGIESPEKRCGKTTLLTVLSELVSRPVVAANISSPAFFRVIEEVRPTLLIDEADTLLRGNNELRGILNSGYGRKTAFVVRVIGNSKGDAGVTGKRGETEKRKDGETEKRRNGEDGRLQNGLEWGGGRLAKFSCWCPKAIAAIGRLPDTLADRCIVIRMQRKRIQEECGRLRDLETESLRRRCARFVKDESARIAAVRPKIPEGLNDRATDIWEPLLALAELAGGSWPERARQAAIALTLKAEDRNPMASLLFDLMLQFLMAERDRVFSRELVAGLNELTERPWMDLLRGKEVTELWLAQRLRVYGVRPRTLRIGEERRKGYVKEELMGVFRRYIPRSELEAFREEVKKENGSVEAGEQERSKEAD